MLSDVPSVLPEYVKCVSQSKELKLLLEYQKGLCQLNENGKHAVKFEWKTDIMMLQIQGTLLYQPRHRDVYLIITMYVYFQIIQQLVKAFAQLSVCHL